MTARIRIIEVMFRGIGVYAWFMHGYTSVLGSEHRRSTSSQRVQAGWLCELVDLQLSMPRIYNSRLYEMAFVKLPFLLMSSQAQQYNASVYVKNCYLSGSK